MQLFVGIIHPVVVSKDSAAEPRNLWLWWRNPEYYEKASH